MTAWHDRFLDAVARRDVELRPSGNEYIARGVPCLRCGAEGHTGREPLDRVRLSPVSTQWPKGHWFCHRCRANNDGIDFLCHGLGMTFRDAHIAVLGYPPPDRPFRGRRGRAPTAEQAQAPSLPKRQSAEGGAVAWRVQDNPWPCPAWTGEAMALIQRLDFRNGLADGRAEAEARQAIEQGRGIRLNNAPAFGVYWNPADRFEPAGMWGLKRAKKLYIPKGILIALLRYRWGPWCESPTVVGLLVRRAVAGPDGCRLQWVPFRDDDSTMPKTRTMVLGELGQPVVVTESALDAALVYQEAQARVAVVSTCGATYPLDADAAAMMREAPKLWAWPDADEAGAHAFRRWCGAFPAMRPIAMPAGPDGRPAAKDPTELARLCRGNAALPTVKDILQTQGVIDV